MTDQVLSDKTEATTLDDTAILYAVADPDGSPLDKKITIDSLRSLIGSSGSSDEGLSFSNVYQVSTYDSLADAVTDIGTDAATLLIDEDVVIPEGTTQDIPSTLTLVVLQGNTIDGVSGGSTETLAIAGVLQAGVYTIFGDDLTVTLGVGSVSIGYPQWWGGTNDNVETATAVQKAVTALEGVAKLEFVSGTYRISTPITITTAIEIYGTHSYTTFIKTASATANIFMIESDSPVIIRDLYFWSAVTRTAGSFISLDGDTTSNSYSVFENITMAAPYNGFDMLASVGYTIRNCNVASHINYAVSIQNTVNPDSGDSSINGCIFNSTESNAIGIYQKSSGGLKLIGNKFLYCKYHFYGNFVDTASSSILIIEGNSFEHASSSNIYLTGSTLFYHAIIEGNQFTVNGYAGITTNANTIFLQDLLISDNTFNLDSSADAIYLDDVDNVTIGTNHILGSGSGEEGIVINSSVTDCTIHRQDMFDVDTNFAISASAGVTWEEGRINVKAWGAKGDGGTNDQPVIQAAATYAKSVGLPLYFPNGTYNLNSTITLTGMNTLIGESKEGARLYTTSNISLITIGADTASLYNSIKNLTLIGNVSGTRTSNHGIHVSGSAGSQGFGTYEDLIFLGLFRGFYVAKTTNSAGWILFDNNTFNELTFGSYNSQGCDYGIIYTNGSGRGNTYTNCKFYMNTTDGGGIIFIGGSTQNIGNFLIQGCSFIGISGTSSGIYMLSSTSALNSNITITGNLFNGVTNDIALDGTGACSDVQITGNTDLSAVTFSTNPTSSFVQTQAGYYGYNASGTRSTIFAY